MSTKFVPVRRQAKDDPAWQIVDCPDPIVAAEIETAYRRGFSQGVSMARQLLEHDSGTVEEIKVWESVIMRWRRACEEWIKGQPVKPTLPPEPR